MVSTYTPSTCKYKLGKLDKFVFFLDKNDIGVISIDDGEAYVNSAATALTIETTSTSLEETESLDERYEFAHSLTFTVDSYMNYKDLNDLYYVVFKDLDGNHWLLNPQFECKVTHTYTINSKSNSTKFVVSTKSNFPLLQVKNFTTVTKKACKTYSYCGIDSILLNETKYSKYADSAVTYTNDGFKEVEFLKDTATFTETFDGTNVSHELQFKIDFDNYKSSWHYNLLEFTENTYALVLSTLGGNNVSCGFNHGLQPSFTIAGSDTSVNSITIKLSDLHDQGFFISTPSDLPYVPSTATTWSPILSEYECVNETTAKMLLKEKQDEFGNGLGQYICLTGYEDRYSYLGDALVGEFLQTETFTCGNCAGTDCSLETSIPSLISFNDTSCRYFSVKANSNWTITTDYSGITASPSAGTSNTLYNVSICNLTAPTSALSSHTLTLNYCNTAKTYDVQVVEASPSACFPQGTTYNVSSESQQLTIPTSCCIKSVTSNSIYVQGFSIQNGYVIMQVYRNDTGSARTVTLTFTLCDNTTVTAYIVQSSFYSRWVKVSEECDGEQLCDVENMLSGTSESDISSPTLWMRYTNCHDSDSCVAETSRWTQTTETTCSNGHMYFVEYLQVYSGGTWVNEGSTRLGEETLDISGICNVYIEHWIVQQGEYLCDDTLKYEKKRLYLQTNEDQPQAEWIETDAYCMGNLIEMDSNDCGYSATTGYTYFLYRPDGEMCDGTSLYERDKLYVSNDEETWIPTDVYQMGALIQQNSESCGYVPYYEYQWVLTDLTVCEGFNKYYKYKEQKRPSGSSATWVDVVPSVYSTDGYGTQTKVLAESASTDCGYVPEIEPQFRWVDLPLSSQYYCSGTTKYYKQQRQISTDSGTTWTNMSPAEYRMGSSAETNSVLCGGGIEPPTPTAMKFFATYNDNTTYSAACDSSSALTSGTTRAHTTSYTAMTSAEIGDCVTSIGEQAFYECYRLSSVTISNSVTNIDPAAFYECLSLSSITIPNSVTSIGQAAFLISNSLQWIKVEAETPPTLGLYAFNITNDCPIYVPCESVAAYKAADVWNNYANRITCLATVYRTTSGSTYCENYDKYVDVLSQVSYDSGLTWTTTATTPTLVEHNSEDCGYVPPTPTATTKFYATYNDGTTYSAACDSSSVLTSGETRGRSSAMTTVEIGTCVEEIGRGAFSGRTSLSSVTIPNSVTSIGSSAFNDCTSLSSITIPNSVTSMGMYCFDNCNSLTQVHIPSGVTTISHMAFNDCTSLSSVTIPGSVTSIGDDAFAACYSLSSITIPDSVTSIGYGAFTFCSGLTSVTIPSGVTTINDYTFEYCSGLTSVTILGNVTSIGAYAFTFCPLTSFTCLATTPPTLYIYAFDATSSNMTIYVPSESVAAYKSADGWSRYASRIQPIQT